MDDRIKAAHEDIRETRAREWKERYCHEHMLYRRNKRGFRVPDIAAAPEPTDEDLNWPEPMATVTWPHGYVTMTLSAYKKLSAADKKKFTNLEDLSK